MKNAYSAQSRWFLFQDNQLILQWVNETLTLPTFQNISSYIESLASVHLLGGYNKTPCFCGEIKRGINLNSTYVLIPLKQAFSVLEDFWFSFIVKSAQILNWNKQHQYCGICGNQTTRKYDVYEAHCQGCKMVFYPRISPSIIVLIKKGSQILMARGPHFAKGIYGLIAGFVCPGETLEEAVHREVMEEVGITIKNLRYFGSQPWPFPDSLMMAFEADYEAGEIVIDDVEIKHAGWYSVDNLPGMPSSSKSIARVMINSFLAGKGAAPSH